jgi:hypothetical protein
MLNRLPGLDPTELPSGECCRYFVESSERILLGPVSLAKFAVRFETPSGAMTKIVFEYPTQAVAAERFRAFRALQGVTMGQRPPKGDEEA